MTSPTNPNTSYVSPNVNYVRPVITTGMPITTAFKTVEDNLDRLNDAVFNSIEADSDWKVSAYAHAWTTNYFGKTRIILRNTGIEINLDLNEDALEELIKDLQMHLNCIRDTRSKWYLGELPK